MQYLRRLIAVAGALCVSGWTVPIQADALVDTVQLVSTATAGAQPPAQTFTVTQAGSYIVTLTDLQLPAQLTSLTAAVVSSTSAAATLAVTEPTTSGSTPAPATQTVSLQPGTYTVQVIAVAAAPAAGATTPGGGTFSIQVVPAGGGAALFQYEDAVAPPVTPTAGVSPLSAQFTVATGGAYQLSAADLAFPAALSSLSIGVFVHCGTTPNCTPTPVYTTTAGSAPPYSASLGTLAAGTYDLFVVATAAAPALQGLYTVQIAGVGGAVYSATQPVGQLPAATPITIASAGSVSLTLADLAAPAALSSIQAIVAQGGTVLDQVSASGTTSFTAGAGPAQLYVLGQPGSSGQGAYEAYLTSGSQTVADIAQPVVATGSYGYAFSTTLAGAGVYQLAVNDFQKPVPLTSVVTIAAQQGAVLGEVPAASSFTPSFNAKAGPLNIIAFPVLPSTSSEGLFSVSISGPDSATTVYQTSQGVGALFGSQTVSVTTAGTYDLNLTDFGFPASFSNLALIATNGNTVVGSIFDAGQLQISLTPGNYVLSVLAQVGPSSEYGLYGLNLAAAPPPPTATLTSSATSVTSGGSATLTWSSTNATSCTASGGWNGTLATSGSQSTGALTQSNSFTLTCTGGGGSATATAQVAVTIPGSNSGGGHGGGAFDTTTLLALTAFLVWELRRRQLKFR